MPTLTRHLDQVRLCQPALGSQLDIVVDLEMLGHAARRGEDLSGGSGMGGYAGRGDSGECGLGIGVRVGAERMRLGWVFHVVSSHGLREESKRCQLAVRTKSQQAIGCLRRVTSETRDPGHDLKRGSEQSNLPAALWMSNVDCHSFAQGRLQGG